MQTQRQEKEEEGKGREGKRPGERRVQEKYVSGLLILSSCFTYTGKHDIIHILILVLEGSFLIFNLNSSNTIFGFTEPGQGKNKTECQDSFSIIDIPEDHVKYYAVYDGHGHVGKSVRLFTVRF